MAGSVEINIEDNPNCRESGQVVFCTEGPRRRLASIVAATAEGDQVCDVTGVGPDGGFVPAYAQKIQDSGEGTAFLIFGGAWGIRLRAERHCGEPWSLDSPRQWGEAYKIYGNEQELIYAGLENNL